MDSDARRNVNLLMIPVIAKFPDGIYKVLCWDIHARHTACAHTFVHICGFYSHSYLLCFSQWGSSLLRATRLCDICSISRVFFFFVEHAADGLAHKNVFHGTPAQTKAFIYHGTVNSVREKIPFLWFEGNISVLKFCGCPAETGAKIGFCFSFYAGY